MNSTSVHLMQCSAVCALLFIAGGECSEPKLAQIHVLFRHGERTPTETYTNDPYINYTWPGGWGQLTNTGKANLYKLGRKFRKYYADFIPDYYSDKDVKIISSYADRCLMSAELFLAGLFPPKDAQIWNAELPWQPIPVKYTPREQDNLLAMKRACKRYDIMFDSVMHSDEIKDIDKANADLYEYLTQNTGDKYTGIDNVEALFNTLEIEILNNLTLPEWTRTLDLGHLKYLATKYLTVFTYNDYMKRVKGGVFVKTVLEKFRRPEDGFVHLYSAHDITLVHILRTMGLVDELKPGFGASFVIELYDNKEIKMFYRDNVDKIPEELRLSKCHPCFIDSFEETLSPLIPIDWENECQLSI